MSERDFLRTAAACAVLTAASGFLYSVVFIVFKDPGVAGLFLLLGGLLTIVTLAGLREIVAPAGRGLSTAAFALAVAAGIGAAAHGGFDLANRLHVPAQAVADLPSPVDPRGLLTFGVAGVSILCFATLVRATRDLPRGLAILGYLAGALLVIVYVARLTILEAANPLVAGPALLLGFIVNPAWYAWVGVAMYRLSRRAAR